MLALLVSAERGFDADSRLIQVVPEVFKDLESERFGSVVGGVEVAFSLLYQLLKVPVGFQPEPGAECCLGSRRSDSITLDHVEFGQGLGQRSDPLHDEGLDLLTLVVVLRYRCAEVATEGPPVAAPLCDSLYPADERVRPPLLDRVSQKKCR